ncbi:MEDS domain-containing protein [Streptomyces sp. NPDC026206]|uniref:MEDS domain-containing protein n=1 Tax=Streptomyces sp. NPDC026206 TaxID=3157089 RepID=UPI0033D310A0
MAHPHGVRRRVHVGDLQPGDHACLLFESDEERASILRDFVLAGLDAEDKILYLSGAEDPPGPGALWDECRLTSVPGGPAGRVEIVRLAEFLTGCGQLEPAALMRRLRNAAERSREEGYRALRVAGDLCAALHDGHGATGALGVARLLRYEALLAEEFSSGGALAVCQYDIRHCEPAALDAFASAHARSVEADPLVRTAGLVVVRTYRPQGLRIEGVVEAAVHRQLRDALRSVAAVRGDVRLEMSRVEFLDLGGLRLLMTFARARAARHATVELGGLPPHLRQVITLVGWDRTPGLRLGDAHAC